MQSSSMIDSNTAFFDALIDISRSAGAAILAIYNAPEKIKVEIKSDDSPLTAADIAAHHIIVNALTILLPIPVISEESTFPDIDVRKTWQQYWLVDPLDGTKEFIARTGEFTVNIALVQHGVPVLGIVHVPVLDETYLGVVSGYCPIKNIHNGATIDTLTNHYSRAEKYCGGEKIAALKTRNLSERFVSQQPLAVLASARHTGKDFAMLQANIEQRWPGQVHTLNAGSSLKFCWIAEGRADFYPRLAPTCEWDTAAAQAVLVAAGGAVVDANNFMPLRCNNSETLLNPSFFAVGDIDFDWALLLAPYC